MPLFPRQRTSATAKSPWAPTLLFIALLFGSPTAASANAGTALMWLTAGHLLFGNFIIGVGEGLLAAWWFKLKRLRVIAIFVLANYASMAAGAFLISGLTQRVGDISPRAVFLYGAALLTLLGVLSWFLSVVIEWPFCLWAVRKFEHRARCATVLSFGLQTASYVVLVPLYLYVSSVTLYTSGKILPDTAFTANPKVELYYLPLNSRDLWSIHLDGSGQRQVAAEVIRTEIIRKEVESLYWVPIARAEKPVLYVTDGLLRARVLASVEASANVARMLGQKDYVGGAEDFRGDQERTWTVRSEFYAVEGLTVDGPPGGGAKQKTYRLALGTPFLSLLWRNITVLPNDEVLAQLGDCIVLVDLSTRRVGFLTEGRAPVVVSIPEQL